MTAARNWTFCWLPFESSSARRSAKSGTRKRASHDRGLAGGDVGRDALEAGEEDELVEDRHLRVQAALFGQVAPGLARQGPMVGAAPPDLARIGAQDAERDAHRGGLPGAVRAEESEHVRFRNLELEPGESGNRAESLDEPVDREGHAGGSIAPGPRRVR